MARAFEWSDTFVQALTSSPAVKETVKMAENAAKCWLAGHLWWSGWVKIGEHTLTFDGRHAFQYLPRFATAVGH
eukprot:2581710-Amphidinium_carterae.2